MWKLTSRLLILFSLLHHALSATLECEYDTGLATNLGNLYLCWFQKSQIFNGSRLTIDGVEGRHKFVMTNEDVKAVNIQSIESLNYFPRNIENHFKNLIAIAVYNSRLREIKQRDLKPFTKLNYLSIMYNNIKVIEADLFKFNPELKFIWLTHNEISQIEPNVFDRLNSLSILDLSGNNCKFMFYVASTRSEVIDVVNRINDGECSAQITQIIPSFNDDNSQGSSELQQKFENSEKLNEELNEKVKNLEITNRELNVKIQSMFDKMNDLRDKYEKLLLSRIPENEKSNDLKIDYRFINDNE